MFKLRGFSDCFFYHGWFSEVFFYRTCLNLSESIRPDDKIDDAI